MGSLWLQAVGMTPWSGTILAGGAGLKVWPLRVPHARFVSVGLFVGTL